MPNPISVSLPELISDPRGESCDGCFEFESCSIFWIKVSFIDVLMIRRCIVDSMQPFECSPLMYVLRPALYPCLMLGQPSSHFFKHSRFKHARFYLQQVTYACNNPLHPRVQLSIRRNLEIVSSVFVFPNTGVKLLSAITHAMNDGTSRITMERFTTYAQFLCSLIFVLMKHLTPVTFWIRVCLTSLSDTFSIDTVCFQAILLAAI